MKNISKDKEYYVLMKQSEQGCDYTIGCGTTCEQLEAINMEEAIDEIIDLLEDWKKEIKIISEKYKSQDYKDYIDDTRLRYSDNERSMTTIKTVDMIKLLNTKLKEVEAYCTEIINSIKKKKKRKNMKNLKRNMDEK